MLPFDAIMSVVDMKMAMRWNEELFVAPFSWIKGKQKYRTLIYAAVRFFVLISIVLGVSSCDGGHEETVNSIYYWGTDFQLGNNKLAFLKKNRIKKIYLRYFDVVVQDGNNQPNATVKFSSPVPKGAEIVPVVFIVNDCMRQPDEGLAEKVLNRVLQMSETNDIPKPHEMQIDCDWTASTRNAFFAFMKEMGRLAHAKGMKLSATIRLHQLSQTPPPVDKGVLMMYNTGDFTKLSCQKPILDMEDAAPYMKYLGDYKLPLASAYPIFGWKILFREKRYVGIIHADDELPILPGDSVVVREPQLEDILKAVKAVGKKNSLANAEMILFDLSDKNINRYKASDYEEIFNR